MLTTEQQTKLVQAAKVRNPNITFEETKSMLTRANQINDTTAKSWLQKAGEAAPGVMGTTGGIIGSLGGPALSAAGAGIGTGVGSMIKSMTTPHVQSDYTTATEPGFKIGPIGFGVQTKDHSNGGFATLSDQGKKKAGMDLANAAKDSTAAAVTAYLSNKALGLGPKGSGFLPALGRIGSKTAAGTGIGAGAGFVSGDLQSTSLEQRGQNAGTGAIVGGALSGVFSTGEEALSGIKKLIPFIKNTRDKENLRKWVQEVNPKVSATNTNYLKDKNAILETAEPFKGKKAAEMIEIVSKQRDENLEALKNILKNKKTALSNTELMYNVDEGIKNIDVNPESPAFLHAKDWINNAIKDSGLTGSNVSAMQQGTLDSAKLYKLLGDVGNKGFGKGTGVPMELKPYYQMVYGEIGKAISQISPEAKNKIVQDGAIRKLLPGIIQRAETSAKTGLTQKISTGVKAAIGVGSGFGLVGGIKSLLK